MVADRCRSTDIDVRVLEPLTEAGQGGQGRVFTTDSARINGSWPVAFKEYLPTVRAGLDVDLLRRMVDFVGELDAPTGEWLCEQAAWPAAVVCRDGVPVGFLMRRIPDGFHLTIGRAGAARPRPAGLQFLLNPDDYLTRIGVTVTDRQRLLLLLDLARTLTRLHSLEIVVGDLSPNNVLFDLTGSPRCFFIDCDGMRLAGASVLRSIETPDWEVPDPDAEPLGTPASDAYKFGLLAVRLFARDQSSRDPTALASASARLGALAVRGTTWAPAGRPTPADWIPALHEALAPVPTWPVVPTPPRLVVPTPPRLVVPTPPRPVGPPEPADTTGLLNWSVVLITAVVTGIILLALLTAF